MSTKTHTYQKYRLVPVNNENPARAENRFVSAHATEAKDLYSALTRKEDNYSHPYHARVERDQRLLRYAQAFARAVDEGEGSGLQQKTYIKKDDLYPPPPPPPTTPVNPDYNEGEEFRLSRRDIAEMLDRAVKIGRETPYKNRALHSKSARSSSRSKREEPARSSRITKASVHKRLGSPSVVRCRMTTRSHGVNTFGSRQTGKGLVNFDKWNSYR